MFQLRLFMSPIAFYALAAYCLWRGELRLGGHGVQRGEPLFRIFIAFCLIAGTALLGLTLLSGH